MHDDILQASDLFLTDFGPIALQLMQQKIVVEKNKAKSMQSAWGAQLRCSANQHSGLRNIRNVSGFDKLSDEEKEKQYGPYQECLKGLVTCIIRAYNATKYEERTAENIPEGAGYDHVLYNYPGEQLGYGQSHTMFQRGGTTADSIMRMTRRNVALKDPTVLKMHTNMFTKQLARIKCYIHDGWPEELELPESTSGAGLTRLNLFAILTQDLRQLGLLLHDDDPGVWTPAAAPSEGTAAAAASGEASGAEGPAAAASTAAEGSAAAQGQPSELASPTTMGLTLLLSPGLPFSFPRSPSRSSYPPHHPFSHRPPSFPAPSSPLSLSPTTLCHPLPPLHLSPCAPSSQSLSFSRPPPSHSLRGSHAIPRCRAGGGTPAAGRSRLVDGGKSSVEVFYTRELPAR